MRTDQINAALADVPHFAGAFPCDRLPLTKQRPLAIIANLDVAKQPGSHWVALFLDEQARAEFYDPLGGAPTPIIARYLARAAPAGCAYNSIQKQGDFSQKCGEHCVLFVRLKALGFSLCASENFVSRSSLVSDYLVTKFG